MAHSKLVHIIQQVIQDGKPMPESETVLATLGGNVMKY